MSVKALLWSFRGRINRKPYWLASAATLVVTAALVGLLFTFIGPEIADGVPTDAGPVAVVLAALWIPFLWIALALGAKRLHDRDKSAWWLLVFYLLPGLLESAADFFVGNLSIVLLVASMGILVWALIELGFLRGTNGANNFGEDPLAPAA